MKIYFFVLLTGFILSCQNQHGQSIFTHNGVGFTNNSPTKTPDEVKKSHEETSDSPTLRCGDSVFTLAVEKKNESKQVILIENGTTIKKINLPTQFEVNGFALNWAKGTKVGFEISVEYGSRIYYQKDFSFVCRQNSFYLDEVKITTFDKHDPENSWTESIEPVTPALPLEKFQIADFIGK